MKKKQNTCSLHIFVLFAMAIAISLKDVWFALAPTDYEIPMLCILILSTLYFDIFLILPVNKRKFSEKNKNCAQLLIVQIRFLIIMMNSL